MSRQALDFLGIMSPGAASIAEPRTGDISLAKTIVPGAAAGVAGYFLWPAHPILGFLAGDAIGLNAFRIFRDKGDDRIRAATNLGLGASGIIGSLAMPKHPVWGWFLGHMIGAVATSFVPGSNAARLVDNWRRGLR